MKKKLFLFSIMIMAVAINAQSSKLTGSWLMTKVVTNNETQEPMFITIFKENGEMEAMGMVVGTWKYDESNKKLFLTSQLDKDFNGEGDVIKLTSDEMIINKDGAKLFYIKVDSGQTMMENKKSALEGTWRFKLDNDATLLLNFTLPDLFVMVESSEGVTSRSEGTWIYNSKENSLLLIGFIETLRGKSKVLNLTSDELILENNGEKLVAKKETKNNNIERLTFKYEDFPEESDCDAKLPWRDFEMMAEFLNNVKAIKYRAARFIEDVNSFKYSTIVSTIKVKLDKPSVMFTNYSVENGDSMQYSQNYKGGLSGRYNNFFPKDDIGTCRFVGVEKVTVPAGTFECTVVEGFDGDKKIKYWLINDKPGIYAKYISESEDVFGDPEYIVTELVEIEQ